MPDEHVAEAGGPLIGAGDWAGRVLLPQVNLARRCWRAAACGGRDL